MHLRVFAPRIHFKDVNIWGFGLDNFIRALPIRYQLGGDFVSGIGEDMCFAHHHLSHLELYLLALAVLIDRLSLVRFLDIEYHHVSQGI